MASISFEFLAVVTLWTLIVPHYSPTDYVKDHYISKLMSLHPSSHTQFYSLTPECVKSSDDWNVTSASTTVRAWSMATRLQRTGRRWRATAWWVQFSPRCSWWIFFKSLYRAFLAHRSLWQKTCMHYQWKMNSFKRNVNYSNEYCLWETRIALSHLVPCRL